MNAIVASKTVARSMQILFVPKNDQSDYKLVPDNVNVANKKYEGTEFPAFSECHCGEQNSHTFDADLVCTKK